MGTNYYLEGYKPRQLSSTPCEQTLHIGKSSYGWVFALHVIPELGINDFPDWIKLFHEEGTRIIDEYDREVSKFEMTSLITDREDMVPSSPAKDQEFLKQNYAVYDEYNCLLRAEVSERTRCIRHGGGSWDLIEGEFS